MEPVDTTNIVQALEALRTAVEGLRAENSALTTQNSQLEAQVADLQAQLAAKGDVEQALADAAGKVAALTEEISSPPPAP